MGVILRRKMLNGNQLRARSNRSDRFVFSLKIVTNKLKKTLCCHTQNFYLANAMREILDAQLKGNRFVGELSQLHPNADERFGFIQNAFRCWIDGRDGYSLLYATGGELTWLHTTLVTPKCIDRAVEFWNCRVPSDIGDVRNFIKTLHADERLLLNRSNGDSQLRNLSTCLQSH